MICHVCILLTLKTCTKFDSSFKHTRFYVFIQSVLVVGFELERMGS
jgi:hypothetical protein